MCNEDIKIEPDVDEDEQDIIEHEHTAVTKEKLSAVENKQTEQKSDISGDTVSKEPENAVSGNGFDPMNPPEENDKEESDVVSGQYEIHNYPEVLPENEKFVPAFGEWVSTRRKACPDEPGEYIAFRKIDEEQCRQSLMSVVEDNGKLRWSFAADRIMFWMPLPENPAPEEY